MSDDRSGPAPEPSTPRQVRDLLGAQPPVHIPVDVAARVSAAIQGESDLRARGGHDATVVTLPDRRRRWVRPALAAAVVLGIVAAGAQVVTTTGPSGGDAASTAAEQRTLAEGPEEGAAEGGGAEDAPEPPKDSSLAESDRSSASRRPQLSTGTFGADVETLVVEDGLAQPPRRWLPLDDQTCARLRSTGSLRVLLDDTVAYLVATGPRDERTYLAIGCAGGAAVRLAATTLPPA